MKLIISLVQESIHQIKKISPVLGLSYLLLLALLASVAAISEYFHVPVSKFTRDPTQILNGHPFTGILSNIGILFWCSTAAICFFSAAIQWKSKRSESLKFLLFSGMISLLLLLDDLFLLHEIIFPKYLFLTETTVYLVYIFIIIIYLVKFKHDILKADYMLLYFALGFFSLSIFSDVFLMEENYIFLLEDGFKLFGIVSWFLFFVRTCFGKTQEALDSNS
jgi:hypothetical protein